jgi:hypothetical protein
LLIGAQIDRTAQNQREVDAVSRNAIAGKHPADRHRPEAGE